jgi:lipoprotein-releasing system ATP-binding protein
MTALIETEKLTRVLPETVPVTLVRDITLTIGNNEFVAITGTSGSGKPLSSTCSAC